MESNSGLCNGNYMTSDYYIKQCFPPACRKTCQVWLEVFKHYVVTLY